MGNGSRFPDPTCSESQRWTMRGLRDNHERASLGLHNRERGRKSEMSKTLDDLIRGQHLPQSVIEDMEKTEPGMLSAALGEMVYARSHDKEMHSVYPEKIYLKVTPRSKYMAEQIGVENQHIKSDAVIAKVIALLDALALQHALERR
jgi:hypothetical protein